jgi:hypothetical protein
MKLDENKQCWAELPGQQAHTPNSLLFTTCVLDYPIVQSTLYTERSQTSGIYPTEVNNRLLTHSLLKILERESITNS